MNRFGNPPLIRPCNVDIPSAHFSVRVMPRRARDVVAPSLPG